MNSHTPKTHQAWVPQEQQLYALIASIIPEPICSLKSGDSFCKDEETPSVLRAMRVLRTSSIFGGSALLEFATGMQTRADELSFKVRCEWGKQRASVLFGWCGSRQLSGSANAHKRHMRECLQALMLSASVYGQLARGAAGATCIQETHT